MEFSTLKEIVFLCKEMKQGKPISKDDIAKLYINVHQLKMDIDKTIQDLNDEVKL
jgi:hypothetical protein